MTTPYRSDSFHEPTPLAEKAGTWFIVTAVAFIVLGTLAIMAPLVAGFAVTTLVGTLLIVGGVMHGIGAFRGGGVGRTIWQLIVTAFYVIAGVYFLTHPLIALTSLTLFLAIVLFVEAVMNVVAYFSMPSEERSGWLLVNAVVSFVLAVMIWQQWPSISVWAIGTLVGVNLLVNGFSRLMFGRAARSVPHQRAA
jgi:uncharacterized membrane protein HdeD (DUF308 family)